MPTETPPSREFARLELPPRLLENLSTLGYATMTPIQALSLPPILQGRDVIAQAKTGSGKTAAFGLGLLSRLDMGISRPQALVLCPTRELADQVARELRKLARAIDNVKILTVCGGTPIGPQLASLEHGAHIVVGTPGRVEDVLRRGKLQLQHTHSFVLDEADRMLDMGFQPAIDAIVEQVPTPRQTLLFSATYPERIEAIARRIMQDPLMLRVDEEHDERTIEQHFYALGPEQDRARALCTVLHHHRPARALVFCATKRDTQVVAHALCDRGFSAKALHGDLDQRERELIMVCFANASLPILVATDVAARGLDIGGLDAVVNYHISRDCEVHVHRVGRTGRAGQRGLACSLVGAKESHKLQLLSEYLGQSLNTQELPDIEAEPSPTRSAMATLQIGGGRKDKLRPGDILGALTKDGEIPGKHIGKIDIFERVAYVAVERLWAGKALDQLHHGKLKGRKFRVRRLPS